jgi:VWFA-related protein
LRQPIKKISAFLFFAVLAVGSTSFLGQDFQLRTKVDLVVVPVSVRDGNGSLVPNLAQEDFTVLEDGKPQNIANFSKDPLPLSVAIVIDTGLRRSELSRLNLLAGTLMHGFTATDEVAIYRYDHIVTRLSDFTDNPQNLQKSFDTVRQIAESKPDDGVAGPAAGPSGLEWILQRTQIGTVGAPSNPTTTPPTAPQGSATNRPAPPSLVLHDAVFTATMDLEKRPKKYRKVMILISDGLVAGDNEHSQGEVNARLFRDDIQFYAVSTDLKLAEHLTALNAYAKNTGGAVFDGAKENSMATSFVQVVEQARDQYVLGYVSNNELAGSKPVLRKIDIKVRGKLRATHRQAYLQYPS